MVGGHAKDPLLGVLPVAQRTVYLCIAIGPPKAKYGACARDDFRPHMCFPLVEGHLPQVTGFPSGPAVPTGLG